MGKKLASIPRRYPRSEDRWPEEAKEKGRDQHRGEEIAGRQESEENLAHEEQGMNPIPSRIDTHSQTQTKTISSKPISAAG